MKRLLLFSALVAASVLNVFAYDFSSVAPNGQTLYYAILNSSEVSVVFPSSTYTMDPYECSGTWTGFTMPTGNLVIPDTVVYNGTPYRVAVIEQGAFYGCTGLTSITIPRSVTTIRALGFWNCTGVTSVFFNAEYCTTDGLYFTGAFEGDTNIASITFGDSVRIIPEFLCYGLSRLTSATFAQAVTTIHNYAFMSCSGLTSVSLPASVTFIGDAAFSQCSGLTSVVIPSSITAIHDMAFYNCSGLTSVTQHWRAMLLRVQWPDIHCPARFCRVYRCQRLRELHGTHGDLFAGHRGSHIGCPRIPKRIDNHSNIYPLRQQGVLHISFLPMELLLQLCRRGDVCFHGNIVRRAARHRANPHHALMHTSAGRGLRRSQ